MGKLIALPLLFVLIAAQAGAQEAQQAQETQETRDRETKEVKDTTAVQTTQNPPHHIHAHELKSKLLWKNALIKTNVSALWGEARNSPHEWGRTWEGYGKRLASSYAQRAVKGLTEFGISSTLTHEDLRYHRSNLPGALPRLKFAIVHTFWLPRDVGDGNTFAAGRVTGAFVAGQVARTWLPARVATFGAGAQSAGLSLSLDVGLNIVKEFWPTH